MFCVNEVTTDVAMRGSVHQPVIVSLAFDYDFHNAVGVNEGTTHHRRGTAFLHLLSHFPNEIGVSLVVTIQL